MKGVFGGLGVLWCQGKNAEVRRARWLRYALRLWLQRVIWRVGIGIGVGRHGRIHTPRVFRAAAKLALENGLT